MPGGTEVGIHNAVVSAVASSGDTAWLAIKEGDAGYNGPGFSGLEVDLSNLSPAPVIAVGDRVSVDGTVVTAAAGNRLTLTDMSVESTGEIVVPVPVSTAEFVTPAGSGPLDSVLVSLTNLTISSQLGPSWLMSEGVTVGSAAIGTLPSDPVGTSFSSLRGIADTLGPEPTLLPRQGTDLVVGP